MNKIKHLCFLREGLYKIHVVTGLAAALFLLLMAVTGVMINHQESLGLLDAEISDKYLPDSYRADVRTGSTRLNIIVTDLHSGRILGAQGHLVGDLVALFLLVSLSSGALSYGLKRRLQHMNHRKEAAREVPPPGNGEQQWRLPLLAADTTAQKRRQAARSRRVGTS